MDVFVKLSRLCRELPQKGKTSYVRCTLGNR